MFKEVADSTNFVCSCSIEVCGPGQACLFRPFGRFNLFKVTEFT